MSSIWTILIFPSEGVYVYIEMMLSLKKVFITPQNRRTAGLGKGATAA